MPSNAYFTRPSRSSPSKPSLVPVTRIGGARRSIDEVSDAVVRTARAVTGLAADLRIYHPDVDAYLPAGGHHVPLSSPALGDDDLVVGLTGRSGQPLGQLVLAGAGRRSDSTPLENIGALAALASAALEQAVRPEKPKDPQVGEGEVSSRAMQESHRELAAQVEELQELNRLKDEFVANVSHELRTPLTAILGNVMTVAGLGEMLGADERRELLRAAERQAKRLAELMENLLAESRLTGGSPSLTLSVVDLGQYLVEVADTLRFRAPERLIQTHTVGRVEIFTDRTLLYRILFNLGDNAVKYSEGRVRFEARREEGGVRIDIVDEGPGIAPEDMSRIFQQFEQLDGSTSRRVGGVGLGLHLCAAAVAALGGRIHVTSAPETGSTFSVWLPLLPPGQPE